LRGFEFQVRTEPSREGKKVSATMSFQEFQRRVTLRL
jgi:hypothetical protein